MLKLHISYIIRSVRLASVFVIITAMGVAHSATGQSSTGRHGAQPRMGHPELPAQPAGTGLVI